MRGLMITAAAAALLCATVANAQSLDISDRDNANNNLAYGSIQQDGLSIPVIVPNTPLPPNTPTGYWAGGGEGGSVEAIISISEVSASFESGVAVSGGWASATSYSGLNIEIFNNSDGLVEIDTFGSTIIPAGFGFYLQNRDGVATHNNIFTGYGQTLTNLTFEDLTSTAENGLLAYSDFDFSVVSNDVTLYSLSGYISLVQTESGVTRNLYLSDPEALDGFVTAYDNPFAYAFAWDATHIVLPLNALIEQGDSRVIEYRTSVTSVTRAECINPTTCLVAYSGFGDPIGRGGGADFDSAPDSLFAGMQFASFDAPLTNSITGIVFDPQQFTPFEFLDGGGAVPEPATWLTMILGFGMLGATLRRRRVVTYS